MSAETLSDAQREANDYNAKSGNLKHYDCSKCKNKGYVAVVDNGVMAMSYCSCKGIR